MCSRSIQRVLLIFGRSYLFVSIPFSLTCCVASKVEENLGLSNSEQKRQYSELLAAVDKEQEQLSWSSAYKRMKRDNIALRQSRQQLEDSKKLTKRRWLELVPRLVSFASIGTSIADLSDLDSDDVNANVSANLNIPNPFEFYASLYAAALQKQNAIWSHELDQRRAYAQLYSAFIEGQKIYEEQAAYESRIKYIISNQSADIAKLLNSATADISNLERRKITHRLSVNRLLNTPGANWKLSDKFPDISYEKRYDQLKIGEKFGKLALNLQAIQLEGALLRVEQVKFQRWPFVSFGLASPPLYTTGENTDFSSDNLFLFGGLSKSIDLTDIGNREDLRNAKRRLQITREQLKLQSENELSRVLQLAARYRALLKERDGIYRQLSLTSQSASSEPDIVIKDIEKRNDLQLNLIEKERQIQQLDLQYIIWDETYWN